MHGSNFPKRLIEDKRAFLFSSLSEPLPARHFKKEHRVAIEAAEPGPVNQSDLSTPERELLGAV